MEMVVRFLSPMVSHCMCNAVGMYEYMLALVIFLQI